MTGPYCERDGVTIYHGDMLEDLPPVVADLLLTDPPYSRAGDLHSGTVTQGGRASAGLGSDQFWLHWFSAVAREMLQHVRPDGHGFIFCDYKTIPLVERAVAKSGTGWAVTQCLVWDRQSMGLGSPFRASHELIAFVRGPDFRWVGSKRLLNVVRFRWPYGEHRHHPAEKPVGLLRYLLEETTMPGALVLDPFVGGGSSVVAARETGRRIVAMDIDEDYCRVTVERLAQSVLLLAAD
jgi:DNA modification methylase